MFRITSSFDEFTASFAEELCIKAKNGELPITERRLTKLEKLSIQPNTCYIFRKSKIKRWTDGLDWSPSRISDCFLVYKCEKLIRKNISFKDYNLSVCAYFPNDFKEKKKLIFNIQNYQSEKFKNFLLNFDSFNSIEVKNFEFMQRKIRDDVLDKDLFYNFKIKRELKLKDQSDDFSMSDSRNTSEIEQFSKSNVTFYHDSTMFGFDFNKNVF